MSQLRATATVAVTVVATGHQGLNGAGRGGPLLSPCLMKRACSDMLAMSGLRF